MASIGMVIFMSVICMSVICMPVMPVILAGLMMSVHLRMTSMSVIMPVVMPVALVVLLPLRVMSRAVVFHLRHISFVAVHVVSNGLDTTIGQLDVIFALGHFAIAMLIVAKVCAEIVVMDFVAVFVFLSLPLITLALILVLGSVVLGDDKHHGYHDHHPAYYKYGYKVHDDYHGTDFGHNEHRDGHVTKGEYHVKLPDGRVQTVTYYVDGYKGYVAEVKYHGKAHHPAGKKHHKGYGHDHGHDHGHGGHSEFLSLPLITVALILFLGSVVLGDDKHYGHHDHHPAYYKYGYKVHDDYHGTDFGHNEHRDGKVTKGEYHVKLPDGRVQTVTYYVDGYKGYVAEVKYHGKAHHPAGKKHHKGYGHDHGHDHGHGHAVMPVIMAGLLITVHFGMTTMPVIVPVIMPIALVVLLPCGMMSLAVVFHLGHISFVAIHVVSDGLDTTIGQLDVIFALGHFAIAMLIVAKVRAVIVVMDFVAVFVISLALILVVVSIAWGDHGKHHGYHDHHPAYYKYGYKVHDDYHGTDFGHNEHRDGKVTKGEYHVKLPDGRVQTVTYYVDGYKGYVAEVKYHGKAHHPAGKKHHKGYGHNHGHGGHSEVSGHQKPGH
eukprot:snap_masked-scaffold835_size90571-processed-gene-0.10 protein:Tk02835 transcript:snap_masked-scaffold835_size90571-processed-gene-0.10-mRNA-1 annotation:"larval cuticle protein a3a-like"